MFRLLSTVGSLAVGSVAAAMGVGFLVGVFGHVIKSRLLILTGIMVVGAASAYIAFGVAKVAG
ncbi:MAG: hypothetical protein ACJ764_09590 [Solirubrobacteraceae bacterium]